MTMTELVDSTDQEEMIGPMTTDIVDQKELAEQLLEQAKEQNIELVGPGGLLGRLTKSVLETALDEEMSEHLGYEKHDSAGRNSGNSRNGTRAKPRSTGGLGWWGRFGVIWWVDGGQAVLWVGISLRAVLVGPFGRVFGQR